MIKTRFWPRFTRAKTKKPTCRLTHGSRWCGLFLSLPWCVVCAAHLFSSCRISSKSIGTKTRTNFQDLVDPWKEKSNLIRRMKKSLHLRVTRRTGRTGKGLKHTVQTRSLSSKSSSNNSPKRSKCQKYLAHRICRWLTRLRNSPLWCNPLIIWKKISSSSFMSDPKIAADRSRVKDSKTSASKRMKLRQRKNLIFLRKNREIWKTNCHRRWTKKARMTIEEAF